MASERFVVGREKGARVINLKGDIDFAFSTDLEEIIDGLVKEGETNVVVDMEDVGFIGSAVIGVLLGCAGRFRRRGGELKICSVPASALEVFDILGVQKFVAVFDTRDDALQASPEQARQKLGIPERRSGEDRRRANLPFQGKDRRKRERRLT